MLVSELFRRCSRLQDCAIKDSAHLTPGCSGEPVDLIQRALVAIDRADIAESEIRSKHYGPTTAVAVLHYKSQRKIINYSYQTSADNVVGKMTIVALDLEMFRLQTVCPLINRHKSIAVY